MGLIFILEFTLLMWHENWIKRGRCWRIVSLIPSSAQKAGIILIPFVPHSLHHLVYLLNLPISLLFSIFSPIILYKDIISGPKHWPPQLSCPIYCSPISSTHRRQTDPKNQILSIIVQNPSVVAYETLSILILACLSSSLLHTPYSSSSSSTDLCAPTSFLLSGLCTYYPSTWSAYCTSHSQSQLSVTSSRKPSLILQLLQGNSVLS